ncbi:MAG: hypothetical protein JNM22_01835 [Saprospiraceae bacterium]|nr:hypothetical protein [Saprospiraceae bacterium]
MIVPFNQNPCVRHFKAGSINQENDLRNIRVRHYKVAVRTIPDITNQHRTTNSRDNYRPLFAAIDGSTKSHIEKFRFVSIRYVTRQGMLINRRNRCRQDRSSMLILNKALERLHYVVS